MPTRETENEHSPEPAQDQAWKAHFADVALPVRLPEEL